MADWTFTGANCASPNPPGFYKPEPSGASCPPGSNQQGIDSAGIPICSGAFPDTNQNQNTSTSKGAPTTNADGSTTQVTTTTTKNNDGSTTTQTTTTNTATNGSQTTTTTTSTGNTPGGVQGVNDSTPDQKQDICAQHPDLNICNNSQVSGTCGTIQCLGDAIQCATLRSIAKRNCDIDADKTAAQADSMYTLGTAVTSGADPLSSSLPTTTNSSNVDMSTGVDSSGFLGGGACFPDTTFTVQGHTITMSFASACTPLLTFRYAIMIIASLICFRMISGAILRR